MQRKVTASILAFAVMTTTACIEGPEPDPEAERRLELLRTDQAFNLHPPRSTVVAEGERPQFHVPFTDTFEGGRVYKEFAFEGSDGSARSVARFYLEKLPQLGWHHVRTRRRTERTQRTPSPHYFEILYELLFRKRFDGWSAWLGVQITRENLARVTFDAASTQ